MSGGTVIGSRITPLSYLLTAHFGSLPLDGHVLVDDADATFLSHGDCQAGFGDGVHGGGNQWHIQLDATGKAGPETDFARKDLGITGN